MWQGLSCYLLKSLTVIWCSQHTSKRGTRFPGNRHLLSPASALHTHAVVVYVQRCRGIGLSHYVPSTKPSLGDYKKVWLMSLWELMGKMLLEFGTHSVVHLL